MSNSDSDLGLGSRRDFLCQFISLDIYDTDSGFAIEYCMVAPAPRSKLSEGERFAEARPHFGPISHLITEPCVRRNDVVSESFIAAFTAERPSTPAMTWIQSCVDTVLNCLSRQYSR